MRGYYFIQEVKECEFTMPRTICVYNIMINYLNFIFLKSSTSLFYCSSGYISLCNLPIHCFLNPHNLTGLPPVFISTVNL